MICVVTHGEVRVLAARIGWGEKKLAALQSALENLITVDISHPTVIEASVEIDCITTAPIKSQSLRRAPQRAVPTHRHGQTRDRNRANRRG